MAREQIVQLRGQHFVHDTLQVLFNLRLNVLVRVELVQVEAAVLDVQRLEEHGSDGLELNLGRFIFSEDKQKATKTCLKKCISMN